MKKFTAVLLSTFFISSAAFASSFYFLVNSETGDLLRQREFTKPLYSSIQDKSGTPHFWLEVTESEYNAGWDALDQARKDALMDPLYQELIDRKPYNLKVAENALIGLLQRTGYLSTNATAVTAGMEDAVELDLIIQASANPTNSVISETLSRFNALRDVIKRNGGDPEKAVINDLTP